MEKAVRILGAMFALLLAVCACGLLVACSSEAGSPSEASEEASAGPTLDDVRALLASATEQPYSNLSFDIDADTIASAVIEGERKQQSITISTTGELDTSGDAPRMHISYKSVSTAYLERNTYDMYLSDEGLIAEQKGRLYLDKPEAAVIDEYANSITSVISPEYAEKILGVAGSWKVEEKDDKTVITITADKELLKEADLIDTSHMEEDVEPATFVVSFSLGDDGRFDTVRVMNSTAGVPEYRQTQTYRYSAYDQTELPEWPDVGDFAGQIGTILTDDEGNRFFVGEDGQVYYVDYPGEESIGYYTTTTEGGSSAEGEDLSWINLADLLDTSDLENGAITIGMDDGFGDFAEEEEDSSSAEPAKREYIEVDGNQLYLDDPNATIEDVGEGIHRYTDKDGNVYYYQY